MSVRQFQALFNLSVVSLNLTTVVASYLFCFCFCFRIRFSNTLCNSSWNIWSDSIHFTLFVYCNRIEHLTFQWILRLIVRQWFEYTNCIVIDLLAGKYHSPSHIKLYLFEICINTQYWCWKTEILSSTYSEWRLSVCVRACVCKNITSFQLDTSDKERKTCVIIHEFISNIPKQNRLN